MGWCVKGWYVKGTVVTLPPPSRSAGPQRCRPCVGVRLLVWLRQSIFLHHRKSIKNWSENNVYIYVCPPSTPGRLTWNSRKQRMHICVCACVCVSVLALCLLSSCHSIENREESNACYSRLLCGCCVIVADSLCGYCAIVAGSLCGCCAIS